MLRTTALVCVLSACAQTQTRDAWFADTATDKWSTLPNSQVHVVPAAHQPQAVALLQSVTHVPAPPALAVPCAPETHTPWLVRGLVIHEATGAFTVKQQGSAVLVQHNSLGSASPMQRRALVVCTPSPVQRAFTTAGSAM